MNEVNTLDPERRIFRRRTLNSNDGIFVSIYPNSAPCEVFVRSLGLNRDHVGWPAPDVFLPHHFKRIVFKIDAGQFAKIRPRGLDLGFKQPRENVLPCATPTVLGDNLEL